MEMNLDQKKDRFEHLLAKLTAKTCKCLVQIIPGVGPSHRPPFATFDFEISEGDETVLWIKTYIHSHLLYGLWKRISREEVAGVWSCRALIRASQVFEESEFAGILETGFFDYEPVYEQGWQSKVLTSMKDQEKERAAEINNKPWWSKWWHKWIEEV